MNRGKDMVPFLPSFPLLMVLGWMLVESPAIASGMDAARPNSIFLMSTEATDSVTVPMRLDSIPTVAWLSTIGQVTVTSPETP